MKMTQCLFGLPLTLGLLSYSTAQAKPVMRPPHVDINVIGDQSGRAAEYSVDANV